MIRILDPRQAGNALRTLRHQQGLTTRDLAERIHLSPGGINKRENRPGAALAAYLDHIQGLGHDLAIVPMPRWGVRPTGTGWPE